MSVNRQTSVANSLSGIPATQQSAVGQPSDAALFKTGPTVQLPFTDKTLRACTSCHRVLTEAQFLKDGCRGCFPKGNGAVPRHKINDYSKAQFSGYVGVVDPSMSWVARVIGLGKKAPMGVYAAQVESDEDEGEDDEDEDDEGADDDMYTRREFAADDGEEDYEREGILDRNFDNSSNKDEEERAAKKSRAEAPADEYADILDGLVDY